MPQSILKLQDPSNEDSVHLLETLLERAFSARGGGAGFAWATEQGVKLLLRDKVFEDFLRKYDFDLVVGVDTTTTPAALKALGEAQSALKGLRVRVFLSPEGRAIFHPKMTWFREKDGGSLVVGSGNLTNGGLWNNWEAFAHCSLGRTELEELVSQWQRWTNSQEARLVSVDAPEAIARAEVNLKQWISKPRVAKVKPIEVSYELVVLIAEVPKSGDRWQQVNFHQSTYESFFGAKVDVQRRMLFQWVKANGEFGTIERRPSVEVISSNYRFELDAAKGKDYPADGTPPIGVYLRIAERTFLYDLVMPSEAQYAELSGLLKSNWKGSAREKKQLQFPALQIQKVPIVARLLEARPKAFLDEETS